MMEYRIPKAIESDPKIPVVVDSEYLEANREEYIERLLRVSQDDDWTGWCQFFLNSILNQADSNIRKAKAILALYDKKKIEVAEITKSQYAIRALDFIFDNPVFVTSMFVKHSGIPKATAQRITRILAKSGILAVWRESSGRRSAMLAFTDLLNIAEGKSIF